MIWEGKIDKTSGSGQTRAGNSDKLSDKGQARARAGLGPIFEARAGLYSMLERWSAPVRTLWNLLLFDKTGQTCIWGS